jgi:putative acetyltransferase
VTADQAYGASGAHSGNAELLIRRETDADHQDVRGLHALAFGDGQRVPELVDALRVAEASLPPMSFVATLGGHVVGHVLLSGSRLDAPSRIVDVLVLSPLGVLPEFQHRGIGTRLVEHALAVADQQEVPLLFLEGSPHYYGKRGFERADAVGFRAPSLRIPAPAFQVARLSAHEPWMTGTFVYSETFWALDCVGLRDPDAGASTPAE